MTVVHVNPGPCNMEAVITAEQDGEEVLVAIESACPSVAKLNERVRSVDPLRAMGWDCPLWHDIRQCLSHADCPVGLALLKAVMVEGDLALPRDVEIRFTTT